MFLPLVVVGFQVEIKLGMRQRFFKMRNQQSIIGDPVVRTPYTAKEKAWTGVKWITLRSTS
jgi:hypothetical protein